jgi:hypothetical protein
MNWLALRLRHEPPSLSQTTRIIRSTVLLI